MTRGHQILSLQLPIEELAAIDAEAQAFPFFRSRSKYILGLLMGRHQMRVEVAPEAQPLIDHYTQLADQKELDHQAQLDQLKADYQAKIDRLQARLTNYDQTLEACEERLEQQRQLIDRLEDDNVALQIKCETDKFGYELAVSSLKKELATARQNEQRWQTNCQQAKDQLKESQKGEKRVQNATHMFQAFEQLLTANPRIGQSVEQGLGHLVAPKPAQPQTVEPSQATKLGEAIVRDFPGAQLQTISDLIQFLRDDPAAREALLSQSAFKTHQAKLRLATQHRKAKKQPRNQ